jgi:hypothetical protein
MAYRDGTTSKLGSELESSIINAAAAFTVNVKAAPYDATGDGSTDDTAAVQAAIDAVEDAGGGSVFFPAGEYSCTDLVVPGSNIGFFGEGDASIVRQRGTDAPAYLFKANPGTEGSSDPDTNDRGITFRDLRLEGTVVANGFASGQNVHLVSLSAVDDVTIERVTFYGFRADGIYLASSHSGATERHNRHIRIINCLFDGVNQDNRNAISVIDCDDLLIQDCEFRNCTRTDMPGAIDLEPNNGNTFAYLRNIRIIGNHFVNCRGTAGAVGMWVTDTQAELTNPVRGIVVANNTGYNVRTPFFFGQTQEPTTSTQPNDILITGNHFVGLGNNSGLGLYPFHMSGVRGVRVVNNIFDDYYEAVVLGYTTSAPVREVDIVGNRFQNCGPSGSGGSCIRLQKGYEVRITDNRFDDTGTVLNFTVGQEGTGVSDYITYARNVTLSGRAVAITAKHASHTITLAANNRAYHNDLGGLSVNAAHIGSGAP